MLILSNSVSFSAFSNKSPPAETHLCPVCWDIIVSKEEERIKVCTVGEWESGKNPETYLCWGPWLGLWLGCWQPPRCVLHRSEGPRPAGAFRIAPVAPSIFYIRYFYLLTDKERQSVQSHMSVSRSMFPRVWGRNVGGLSSFRAKTAPNKLHALSSDDPKCPHQPYAVPW